MGSSNASVAPEQIFPLARPLLGQQRIAAHHEALAGIGVASDLHQVGLVEQRQLHRARLHQRADRRTPQRADPVQPRRPHVLADARLGQHPAVAHQHHPGEPEAAPELVDLRAHGGRVRGVAVEHLHLHLHLHLHRHRPALGAAQQSELDLQLAALAVARVATPPQRAVASFQIHRGEVVEHQGAALEMPPGQAPLDGVLTLEQPVHGGVEIVLAAVFQLQRFGERVGRGRPGQAPGGGQFRAGVQDPGDDHRQHAAALRRVGAGDHPVQPQIAQRPEHGGDMAVGLRADDVEGVVEAGHRGAAFEQHAQALDQRRGPFGEVGQGAFPDLAPLAPAFAQEDGGRRVAVGDGFDVHGNYSTLHVHRLK